MGVGVYKRIVGTKVRQVFDEINRGNYMAMIDGLAPSFEYTFHGNHALGGRRTTRESMIDWWERVLALLPGATFTIHEVLVSGPPWHTRVAVRGSIAGSLPADGRYENSVFQFMTLKWGKVSSVETVEDLQKLQYALWVVAENGDERARAQPITD